MQVSVIFVAGDNGEWSSSNFDNYRNALAASVTERQATWVTGLDNNAANLTNELFTKRHK